MFAAHGATEDTRAIAEEIYNPSSRYQKNNLPFNPASANVERNRMQSGEKPIPGYGGYIGSTKQNDVAWYAKLNQPPPSSPKAYPQDKGKSPINPKQALPGYAGYIPESPVAMRQLQPRTSGYGGYGGSPMKKSSPEAQMEEKPIPGYAGYLGSVKQQRASGKIGRDRAPPGSPSGHRGGSPPQSPAAYPPRSPARSGPMIGSPARPMTPKSQRIPGYGGHMPMQPEADFASPVPFRQSDKPMSEKPIAGYGGYVGSAQQGDIFGADYNRRSKYSMSQSAEKKIPGYGGYVPIKKQRDPLTAGQWDPGSPKPAVSGFSAKISKTLNN